MNSESQINYWHHRNANLVTFLAQVKLESMKSESHINYWHHGNANLATFLAQVKRTQQVNGSGK